MSNEKLPEAPERDENPAANLANFIHKNMRLGHKPDGTVARFYLEADTAEEVNALLRSFVAQSSATDSSELLSLICDGLNVVGPEHKIVLNIKSGADKALTYEASEPEDHHLFGPLHVHRINLDFRAAA